MQYNLLVPCNCSNNPGTKWYRTWTCRYLKYCPLVVLFSFFFVGTLTDFRLTFPSIFSLRSIIGRSDNYISTKISFNIFVKLVNHLRHKYLTVKPLWGVNNDMTYETSDINFIPKLKIYTVERLTESEKPQNQRETSQVELYSATFALLTYESSSTAIWILINN